ncbi:MAG: UDP-forming cellulose synthase catalytic subunit [Aquificota bacterium]
MEKFFYQLEIEYLFKVIFFTALFIFLLLITINFQIASHEFFGLSVIVLMIFLSFLAHRIYKNAEGTKRFIIILIITLGTFLILKYFYWRTTVSLPSDIHFPDFIAAFLLYLAEAYTIIIFFTGVYDSLRPLNRKIIPITQFKKEELPTVDVFIPTYNEPFEVLAPTVLNALKMDYPKNKFKVYILDDGGTDQKCNDPDPEKAAQARKRRRMLQEFAKKVGAIYLTRKENKNAKAGNINEALKKTNGDLILILDTDHIPAKEFLRNTVGWFLKDKKIFLLQTPHAFYNPDPVEKNLKIFEKQPQENEMFYKWIQKGLDFWESSFFCGSAALLRRKYLEEVGGIQGTSITEDAETALTLHAKGYKSVYIDRPMVRGLQPESFSALVTQRVRWTQGMVQIFLLKNPLLQKGLKWYQKLGYFASSFYWFFGLARFMFLISPFFFVFLGWKIYNASLTDIIALTIPAVLASYIVSFNLYRDFRVLLSSELYETILCVYTVPAIISVLRNPRSPEFKVTPKGERLDTNFISQVFFPLFLLWFVTLVAIVVAIIKAYLYADQRYAYIINLGWLLFNFVMLTAGLAVASEKAEKRRFFRMKLKAKVEIPIEGQLYKTDAIDISFGGLAVKTTPQLIEALKKHIKPGNEVELIITNTANESKLLKGKFYKIYGNEKIVFQFDPDNIAFQEFLTDLIFGRAENWILYERNRPIDYFIIIKRLLTVYKYVHWKLLFKAVMDKFKEYFHQFIEKQSAPAKLQKS